MSTAATKPATAPAVAPANHLPSRAAIFDGLSKTLPLNELGLPKYLYRADLIPGDFNNLPANDRNDYLNAATIAITYREGYPTFFDGTPIWEQMDAEDDSEFGLFQVYLNLFDRYGYRQLTMMIEAIGEVFPPLKAKNRVEEKQLLRRVQEIAAVNFWFLRAKAKDLFQQAMHRKVRENRLMQIENTQYLEADKILTKLYKAMDEVMTPEKMAQMEVLDFVKAIKEAAAIQRSALGLAPGSASGNRKGDEGQAPQGASLEVTLRQVAKITGATDTGGPSGNNQKVLALLRENPEAVEAAQELILSVGMGNRKASEVTAKASASDEREDAAMVFESDE